MNAGLCEKTLKLPSFASGGLSGLSYWDGIVSLVMAFGAPSLPVDLG